MIDRRRFLTWLGLAPAIAVMPKMFTVPTSEIGWFVKAEKGYDYVIGVDTGGFSNPSVISVWRKELGHESLVQVAEYSSSDDPLITCEKFGEIYGKYLPHGPLFSIEQVRSSGDFLQHNLKLAGFHRHHKAASYGSNITANLTGGIITSYTVTSSGITPKEGWYTTAWSRPIMIDRMLTAYQEKHIVVGSHLLRKDLEGARFGMTMTGKRILTLPSGDDSRFMAAAIAVNSALSSNQIPYPRYLTELQDKQLGV